MASPRVQRWALTLAGYRYDIRYKAGTSLGNADALSRLPLPETVACNGTTAEMEDLIDHIETTSVDASQIADWTASDSILSQVKRYILTGWPAESPGPKFTPYYSRKNELSTLNGCILLCSTVVVPSKGQEAILTELHETHPGVSQMKQLTRTYVWWPQMESQIEKLVQRCNTCQQSRSLPAKAPLHPWEWPKEPWSRLHLDFAGPYLGKMYLVAVDAHSKWLEVHIMPSITSTQRKS